MNQQPTIVVKEGSDQALQEYRAKVGEFEVATVKVEVEGKTLYLQARGGWDGTFDDWNRRVMSMMVGDKADITKRVYPDNQVRYFWNNAIELKEGI